MGGHRVTSPLPTGFAIIGCGYVADFYLATLGAHPELDLIGVFDRDRDRTDRLKARYNLHGYRSLGELLDDPRVKVVANLTNPKSHFEVSWAALEASKHVYSEKPLATELSDARALVEAAERHQLLLLGAPCNVLGESAQTMWKALRDGRIGTPRLVYAELDDGPVPLKNYRSWMSKSGVPWPAKDEFETGCALEHAGYYLTWLTAFFGPATRITPFSQVLMHDKGVAVDVQTPDFGVACIEFRGGITARLTCSIYASEDRGFRIFGDAGVLSVHDCWDYASPVHLRRRNRLGLRLEAHPTWAKVPWLGLRRVPPVRKVKIGQSARGANPMDFCRGIGELVTALNEARPPCISARWALHVNELALAMQGLDGTGSPRDIDSTFEPVQPMPWAG